MAERPAYWAVIPASVRYDQDLPPNAKLLYGEVTALSDKRGYCYAQNGYFSALFSLSERSITRLFAVLVDRGYLRVDVIRDDSTQEVLERRIYPIYDHGISEPPPDNFIRTPPDNSDGTPPDKNVGENNTSIEYIPPIVPQGGQPKKKRNPKSVPTWKPERFEAFLEVLPPARGSGECRQGVGQAQAGGRSHRHHRPGPQAAGAKQGLGGALRLPVPPKSAVAGRAAQ